jgi:hypothetical protein
MLTITRQKYSSKLHRKIQKDECMGSLPPQTNRKREDEGRENNGLLMSGREKKKQQSLTYHEG